MTINSICREGAAQMNAPPESLVCRPDLENLDLVGRRLRCWTDSLDCHSNCIWDSGKSEEMRVRDLTHDRDVSFLRELNQPRFADGFTSQGLSELTENRISLRYYGTPAGAGQGIMRWLIFDTQSGALTEKRDEPDPPVGTMRAVLEAPNHLRIETTWRRDSKTGDIDVIDSVSGKHRQHISTLAQRPVGISPDGDG